MNPLSKSKVAPIRDDLRSATVTARTIFQIRAGDGTRTHDNHVGNVVLYQLSYTRNALRQDELSNFAQRRQAIDPFVNSIRLTFDLSTT